MFDCSTVPVQSPSAPSASSRGVADLRSTAEQVGPSNVPPDSAAGVTPAATPPGGSLPAPWSSVAPKVKPAAVGGFFLDRKGLALEEKDALFDRMADHVTSSFPYSEFIGGATAL